MRFKVAPAAALAAVRHTAAEGAGLSEAWAGLDGPVSEAMRCCRSSDIESALADFYAIQLRGLTGACTRVQVGVDNATLAVEAYRRGSHNMMLNFQRNASRLSDPFVAPGP